VGTGAYAAAELVEAGAHAAFDSLAEVDAVVEFVLS
jgi:hypothetical protein